MSAMTPMQRFRATVTRDSDGCWIWGGANICPAFYVAGSTLSPRRWYWETTRGTVPTSSHLWAKCGKPLCVNPACVEIRTPVKPQLEEAC